MGLYIKIHRNLDTREDIMLNIFKTIIDRLEKYFNFEHESKFELRIEDHKDPIWESYEIKADEITNFIEKSRVSHKQMVGKVPHYSINVEGVIQLNNSNREFDHMIIDVIGTCTSSKDIYGNIRIYFYNTEIKWEDYFVGNKDFQNENKEKIINLIRDITQPDFNLYSIFFAKSNIVFDVLNDAFFIYFKEYKYFIEYILEIIRNRIFEGNLEYENILITPKKRPLLTSIKTDLKLLVNDELASIIDRTTSDYNRHFHEFIGNNYETAIYQIQNSIEIYDMNFNINIVRDLLTDFIGNFLTSLDDTIPKYKDVEKLIKVEFSKHQFTPEIKEKQQNITKKFN